MADAHEAPVAQSLVAKIVSGYVKKNRIAPADVSALIDTVYRSLLALTQTADPEPKANPSGPDPPISNPRLCDLS
jgi:predicted transcriptional regulator